MPASTDGAISVHLDDMLTQRGMTLTELAKRIGITQANASILKTGKAKAVRFSTLSAICDALECQPGDLLRYDATKAESDRRSFNVVLHDPGDNLIRVIKEIRAANGASLKAAREMAERTPSVIDRLERPDAEALMDKFRAVGASVELT